jgi:tetratricopeptide (TPR) repeat protein
LKLNITYTFVRLDEKLVKICFLLVLSIFCLKSNLSFSQNAKELYKNGIVAQKNNNHKEAIKHFSKAIDLKPDYSEAYWERANSYFKLKNFELALPDYVHLHRRAPLNENYIIKLAITYMQLKRWSDAQYMLMKLEADDMNLHIAEAKVKMAQCKIMLKNFEEAVQYLSESISIFADDDQIYYYKGVASDSLKDYQTSALCYSKSIEIVEQNLQKKNISSASSDSLKLMYLLGLGYAQNGMYDFKNSKLSYSSAIKISPKNPTLYLSRANICLQNNEVNEALNDLKTCELLNLNSYAFYYTKAKALKKAGQFNQAIESLNPITLSDTAFYAKFLKGQCLESIGKFEEAQQLYQKANNNVPTVKQKEMDAALKRIRNRVYELKREADAPIISILSPALAIDKKIMIPKSQKYVEIKGRIYDKSLIKSVILNDIEADFEKDSLNPNFKIKLNLLEKDYLRVKVLDTYSNVLEENFEFNRTEKNIPKHKLYCAYSEKEAQIYIDKHKNKIVKISGRVDDESNIKRIMINNKAASYSLTESNPFFEAEIDVSKSDTVKILIIDEYDNMQLTSYFINAKVAEEIAQNPMGKTWLVFIANSNYENYSTLTGPEKDLNQVRNALLQYQFDNIISKSNMTLNEMEKFFRIELRDLIKEQGVNSIMVWFAGHGKYTNETGYWLPVNAKKDDELSYYPIPYLRSNLGSYGKSLRNILIVSDACESGPSFSLSEEVVNNIDCNMLETSNFISAYVFSSTTNEKASDNSIFCETFTDLLNSNQETCLPLYKIVKKVSEVVEKSQHQRCKFGKIKDVPNNSGSFFFLRRTN